jgi:cobalamin biosynthesis Mg chelatase CobN
LRALDVRIWVTSHHRAIYTDRAEFLADLADFAVKVDERSEKLIGYLRDGPQSLAQLAQRRLLYPPGFSLPYVESAERNSIRMHLEELVAQGVVRQAGQLFELS